nr:MAG TPA: hypothetical protein [Caudoviricetes sp.]
MNSSISIYRAIKKTEILISDYLKSINGLLILE